MRDSEEETGSCADGDTSDSDDCEFGKNLSLPLTCYHKLKPDDRRCSYCGAYKGLSAKTIMECMKDGRKLCQRCIPKHHKRHSKYFRECTTKYVFDGDMY